MDSPLPGPCIAAVTARNTKINNKVTKRGKGNGAEFPAAFGLAFGAVLVGAKDILGKGVYVCTPVFVYVFLCVYLKVVRIPGLFTFFGRHFTRRCVF